MKRKAVEENSATLKRRIRRLGDGRDQWKEMHKKGQVERKRLREKVKDEIERRDRWKSLYKQKEKSEKSLLERTEELEAQIALKEHENEDLKKTLEEIKKNSTSKTGFSR